MKRKKFISILSICSVLALHISAGAQYADVSEKEWYYNAVKRVSDSGFMESIGDNFKPEAYVTHKEFASALYKIDGKSADITEFDDSPVTREELAEIIYRYDKSKGIDTEKVYNPNQVLLFDDFSEVSEASVSAMRYCIAKTLMIGNGAKGILPKNLTTRAQAAAILDRYISDGSPDYDDMKNWALYGYGENKKADVFFLCPLVDKGRSGNYNLNINYDFIRTRFEGSVMMEAGIYSDECCIYAPYYRQYTLTATKPDGTADKEYEETAYGDVKAAFEYYLNHSDGDRPLIIAGFSQGSHMALRLMKEFFGDTKLSDRLIASYIPGWRITEEDVKEYPFLRPASGETDTGVIICYDCEAENMEETPIIPKGVRTYSINPLNWRTDAEFADKSLNNGACATDYSGAITKEIPNLSGAYIDPVRGALKITDVTPEEYPGDIFEDGSYHMYDLTFFYRNIQENVKKRTDTFMTEKNK